MKKINLSLLMMSTLFLSGFAQARELVISIPDDHFTRCQSSIEVSPASNYKEPRFSVTIWVPAIMKFSITGMNSFGKKIIWNNEIALNDEMAGGTPMIGNRSLAEVIEDKKYEQRKLFTSIKNALISQGVCQSIEHKSKQP